MLTKIKNVKLVGGGYFEGVSKTTGKPFKLPQIYVKEDTGRATTFTLLNNGDMIMKKVDKLFEKQIDIIVDVDSRGTFLINDIEPAKV